MINYHLVTGKTFEEVENEIKECFSKYAADEVINETISVEGETTEKEYKLYNGQMFTLGGQRGTSPGEYHYFENTIFKLLDFNDKTQTVLYKIYIPTIIVNDVDETEYKIEYRESELQFIKEDNVWKLNTVIGRLCCY